MLFDQPRPPPRVPPRQGGDRADEDLDLTRRRDPEHAEAEPAAEIAETRVAFAPVPLGGDARRQPDLVAGRGPIDRLQDEFEIEGELHLADDDERRLAVPQRDQVAAADLAFDGKPEVLEEAFDRRIE